MALAPLHRWMRNCRCGVSPCLVQRNFEKRKVAIGTCARAFGSPCVHEHACVRCVLLRPDPAQRARLEEIRDNLIDRIAEAEREGWLGEVEGLQVSLAGANDKLAQLDRRARNHATITTVDLGMPTPSARLVEHER